MFRRRTGSPLSVSLGAVVVDDGLGRLLVAAHSGCCKGARRTRQEGHDSPGVIEDPTGTLRELEMQQTPQAWRSVGCRDKRTPGVAMDFRRKDRRRDYTPQAATGRNDIKISGKQWCAKEGDQCFTNSHRSAHRPHYGKLPLNWHRNRRSRSRCRRRRETTLVESFPDAGAEWQGAGESIREK